MTVMEVLKASELFTSNTDIFRAIKQNSVKINDQLVEDVNEIIEHGDFLNFIWHPKGNGIRQHAIDLIKEHGLTLLIVAKGKTTRAIVKVVNDNVELLV